MRRRVALCNFNPVDYSRWEGQEGVGLQGRNATDVRHDKNPIPPYGMAGGETVVSPPRMDLVAWWVHRPACCRIRQARLVVDHLASMQSILGYLLPKKVNCCTSNNHHIYPN